MPLLQRPLSDRIARPLRAAVVWGLATGAVGGAIALFVGGAGWIISWIAAQFGDGAVIWPGDVVLGILGVMAVLSLAGSTWAAVFASASDTPVRAGIAALVGVAILIGGGLLGTPVVILAAATVAWSLAIPFERWARLGVRLAPGLVVSVVGAVPLRNASTTVAVVALLVGYPLAATLIGAADRTWRAVAWKRAPQE